MSPGGRPRDPVAEARRVQREAADPGVSAAVRAAAGAGKTRLLVDRLLRLLLAGAEPAAIVAVTFTRKAAVEIKQRLLAELRALAAAPAPGRRELLRELLDAEPTEAQLALPPRLYDGLLEDLAGLPIGTIHGWCQRVLGRFAADLGLEPDFAVAERPDELWAEALDRLEREAAADPAARAAWATLAPTPEAARRALDELWRDRLALDRWLERLARGRGVSAPASDRAPFLPPLAADLRDALLAGTPLAGLAEPAPADLAPLLASAAAGLATAARGTIAAGEGGAPSEALQKQLDALAGLPAAATAFAAAPDDRARAAAVARLRAPVLTKSDSLLVLNGRKASKSERMAAFAAAARPLLEALALLELVALWQRNVERLRAGLRALDLYEAIKRRERVIDFHDLERLARHLVAESELAPFVQYRLDAAVEHLLVDEFQDTNLNQWDVLQPLVAEFLAGEGAAERPRTLLVVGDAKQSIYRFRGAEPGLFARVEADLRARAGDGGDGPRVIVRTLPTNFRSVPAVVDNVGRLFRAPALRDRLPPGEAEAAVQEAARPGGAGDEFVVVPAYGASDEEGAVDRAASAAAAVVARLLAAGTVRDEEGRERPLRADDVMLLSRSRTHVGPYEAALRRAGVRVAPSGRGALARSREVQDILLLLRWLVFPDDDATLAAVLRSPLFRVPESALQTLLAARRRRVAGRPARRSLWQALRHVGDGDLLAGPARLLAQWRRHAGIEACHELLRRIYRDGAAPERFAAALGEQARWNLLRLHDLALQLDAAPNPSLRRFADLIAREAGRERGADEAAVPEHGEGRVALLTVHGAKGLEKPAVLLIDAAAPLRRDARRLPLAPDGPVVRDVPATLLRGPGLPAGEAPVVIPSLAAAARAALAAQEQEDADLLYVALTRARDRLWVLGSAPARGGDRPSFHAWLQEALATASATPGAPPPAREEPDWLAAALAAPPVAASPPASAAPEAAPAPAAPAAAAAPTGEVVAWTPPPTHARTELRTPSALGDGEPDDDVVACDRPDTLADARAPGGGDGDPAAAADRGTAIHLWLRLAAEGSLPPAPPPGAPAWAAEALAEARAVATNPALGRLFRPPPGVRGLSEVPFLHRLAPGRPDGAETRVHGVIDRLLVGPDGVEIVDYKSNGLANEDDARRLAAHYRPQLTAYAAAAAALFPGRPVRARLLFTRLRDDEGGQGRLLDVDPGLPETEAAP